MNHPYLIQIGKNTVVAIVILLCSSWIAVVEVSQWKSKYHKVEISYSKPWQLLIGTSTKEKTMLGLIDSNDGKSIMVKVAKDVSQDLLADSSYYSHVKHQMLNENANNSLLKEDDIQYHGKDFS